MPPEMLDDEAELPVLNGPTVDDPYTPEDCAVPLGPLTEVALYVG